METLNERDRNPLKTFEKRKQDHIELSLKSENEAFGETGLNKIQLIHEALPEIDFEEVSLKHKVLGFDTKTPFLVSSMTAGHYGSLNINRLLAEACESRGWLMGVGSQRRELTDKDAAQEWKEVRKYSPKAQLLGNLGLSQLIQTEVSQVVRLVENLEATAMIIHLNPLQECLQPEGTPQFKGGLNALEILANKLSVPVVVKETGCGFSRETLNRLSSVGVQAVDVSGYGGTHWGRIEGQRSADNEMLFDVSKTFSQWGISTLESVINATEIDPNYEVWASGGARTGLDAAKFFALGAQCVGFAKPILEAALQGAEKLSKKMETIEYELKTALFCTGCKNVEELKGKQRWQWQRT